MSTENQVTDTGEVDVFSMSDEDFAKLDFGSLESPAEESAPADSPDVEEPDESELQVESDEEVPDEPVEDDDEYIDVPDEDGEEQGEESEPEESEEDSDAVDFQAEYEKLIGTPIKANGKDITIDNMEDAIKLIQMGANYYKKVESLKPAQRIISMLENNNLLDESKLGYAIDLINKNPQAINKLVTDMDLSEIVDEKNSDYKPTDYSVSDQQMAVDNALKDIKASPQFNRTITVIGSEWDEASRDIIKSNPVAIGLINQHMESGVFDKVTQEVEKRKMLGTIPRGLSDIEAYKFVGDQLYANVNQQAAPQGQQQPDTKANVPPIRKPSKDTVIRRKKAASNTRGKSTVSADIENVFALSDEEFMAKFGKNL